MAEEMFLSKMLTDEYRELLEHCVHCGLCLEACPTYAIFGTEMDAPRGRIALMRAAVEGSIPRESLLTTFAEHMSLCLECRACESACPSGVQYGKLIEGARIALEEMRKPGVGERLVRWVGMSQLMPHVGQLKALATLLGVYEATGLQWLVRSSNALPQPLHALEGILPEITFRHHDYSRPAPALGEMRGKVAFFHGCIQEAFLAGVNAATISVLQRNGFEVHFPKEQTCCGAAQWHTGDEKLTRQLARQNIDTFLAEDYVAIINNAGGCGATLKEYPDLFRDDPEYGAKAQRFAALVKDFSEFLLPSLRETPKGELRVRVTYSDSCHLRHGQKVIDQPRALLRLIPGLELVELKSPDKCCGSAGIYNIVQNETSSAVLATKMEDIAATGADIVAVSNTGCHMQLVAGVRKAGLNAKVLHIAELLDLSYAADDRRLRARVRHPRTLLPGPKPPQRWLSWQERRLKRSADTSLASLKSLLEPGQVLDDPIELLTYQADGGLDRGEPGGIVFPYSEADVAATVRYSREKGLPLIARGAGTGLAGNAVPRRHGLVLSFSHMRRLLEFDPVGRSAVIQPGIVNLTLDEFTRSQGLYFPPDPASGRAATVGGNIGANAGGPHCFKYGVTTNYITGLRAVLADGRAVQLGGRAFDYPELDMVGLMTGSEGTLAVVTEASVRLVKNPPAVKTLLAAFETVEQAGDAVSAMIAAGLVPAAMEMMCHRMMGIVEEYNHPGLPTDAGAAIVIDVDGHPASLQPQIDTVTRVLNERGATSLRVAQSEAERTKLWYARKSAAGALARVALDHYTVDGTVPRSKLAQALSETVKICEELDLPVAFLLHAGDGNLHPMVLVEDPSDPEFLARLHEGGRRMAELFVALGGTITGEHGVGIEKRPFMPLMFNADELNAMCEIKGIFDPEERLNPEKVLPTTEEVAAVPSQDARRTVEHPIPAEAFRAVPGDIDEAADFIGRRAALGRPIWVLGAGTKTAPPPFDACVLSTQRLRGIQVYPHDLYVTAGAGVPLEELQTALAREGAWVPLISPWPISTVGGIVSTNANAPLRMRYGSVRDLVMAMTAVLPDGRIIRAGRPVMKNVAGYDLAKLFVGAYGSMGLVGDVSFRIYPLPVARCSYAIPVAKLGDGLAWGQRLFQESLVASSILLARGGAGTLGLSGDLNLLYTAEGSMEDIEAEADLVRAALRAVDAPMPVELECTGSDAWANWIREPVQHGVLLRVGVPPKDVAAFFEKELAAELEGAAYMIDVANGHVFVRGACSVEAVRRAAQRRGGYAAVLGASPDAASVERWGHVPDTLDLMRALKVRWDPAGIMNPGAFIV